MKYAIGVIIAIIAAVDGSAEKPKKNIRSYLRPAIAAVLGATVATMAATRAGYLPSVYDRDQAVLTRAAALAEAVRAGEAEFLERMPGYEVAWRAGQAGDANLAGLVNELFPAPCELYDGSVREDVQQTDIADRGSIPESMEELMLAAQQRNIPAGQSDASSVTITDSFQNTQEDSIVIRSATDGLVNPQPLSSNTEKQLSGIRTAAIASTRRKSRRTASSRR